MKSKYQFILFIIIMQAIPAFAQSKVIAVPKPTQTIILEEKKASPEPPSAMNTNAGLLVGKDFMIVTANPLASEAGYDILKNGGTAADAAFAAQLVLGLVEPQSSGLGGGAYALYWDAKAKELSSFDARETAPASATANMFLNKDGTAKDFDDAAIGGRSVGIPGVPKLLDLLQQKYGTATREDIFSPALELSQYGFIASPRLAELVKAEKDHLRFFKSAKDYFLSGDGTPVTASHNIRNPDYNSVLLDFKDRGADIFYGGSVSKEIIAAVKDAWFNPADMTLSDFSSYEVKVRDPVCSTYHTYKVCSMGESSSGGLTLIAALKMLERFDLGKMQPSDVKPWHLIAEASRLAFADRNLYMADPDQVKTPGTALIDPAYLAVRSSLMREDSALQTVSAGVPTGWGDLKNQQAADSAQKNTGTTHISAVDKQGNVISMTSSIESAFGAKMMVHGFLLNNQLTDFAFVPEEDGIPVANRAAPGKRPRSSMTPVIVFDENGAPVMAIGSAGGSRIIGYVLQRIIAMLDWNMPLDQALSMQNFVARDGLVEIEENARLQSLTPDLLQAMGHHVKTAPMNSGLSALYAHDGLWFGAADPRREGVALGQ